MKKIWMMLLMISTVFAFSACSDDDDDKTPVNPVSNAKVESPTAEIGQIVTISGTGFTTPGITLYLEDAEKTRTKVEQPEFSETKVTFIAPNITPGKYEIFLVQGVNEWSLGNVTLEAVPNPILSPSVPEGIVNPGQQVTIGGIGYENTDKISLKAAEGEAIAISAVTATDNGLEFVLPEDLALGKYTVTLIRDNHSWELTGTLNVEKEQRIKSISIKGAEQLDFKLNYNSNNQLISVEETGNGLTWNFTYTENKITTTGYFGDIEELEFELNSNGNIIKSTEPKPYPGDETELYNTWSYDTKNYLTSIINGGKEYEGMNLEEILYDTEGNIVNLGGQLKFSYKEATNAVLGTPDIPYILNFITFYWGRKEDVILGILLNKNGKTSPQIPTQISTMIGWTPEGGYEYSDYSISTTWENNVLTIETEEPITNSIIITYENVE